MNHTVKQEEEAEGNPASLVLQCTLAICCLPPQGRWRRVCWVFPGTPNIALSKDLSLFQKHMELDTCVHIQYTVALTVPAPAMPALAKKK